MSLDIHMTQYGPEKEPDLLSLGDALAEAARRIEKTHVSHSGSCCRQDSKTDEFTVTPESCKCSPNEKAFHAALSAWDAARKRGNRARFVGTLEMTIPAIGGLGWIPRLVCWWQNLVRGEKS